MHGSMGAHGHGWKRRMSWCGRMVCAVCRGKGGKKGVQGDEPGMTGERQTDRQTARQPARRDPMSLLPSRRFATKGA